MKCLDLRILMVLEILIEKNHHVILIRVRIGEVWTVDYDLHIGSYLPMFHTYASLLIFHIYHWQLFVWLGIQSVYWPVEVLDYNFKTFFYFSQLSRFLEALTIQMNTFNNKICDHSADQTDNTYLCHDPDLRIEAATYN